ncbi:hypothetical protein JCM8097_006371 [Rhodosporidiobolus ruineniae]
MALHLAAHALSDEPQSNITHLALVPSSSLFASATTDGWNIYRTNPLTPLSQRDLPDSSLRFVVPLEQSNLVFLVGGPPSPLYPPNKVVLWDDQAGLAVAELEFREDVRGLAVRSDRLVVVLKRRVVLFVLGRGRTGLWREGTYETCDNPKGLVALATEPNSTLLAFPGRQPGQVQLVRLPPFDPSLPPLPPPPSHDPTAAPYPSFSIILAHESALSALATTPSGNVLATASSKGTLVRVWDPSSSYLIRELRRGTDTAEIFGIALRKDGQAVAVSSDKGTVHVWDLSREAEERRKAAQGSESGSSTPRQKQLSLLKPYLPKYFSSTWSHSQFRLPPPAPPASRLPFTLSNPGPIPPNPLAAPSAETKKAPTVEDDVCVCCWVEVEIEVPVSEEEGRDERPESGAATPVGRRSSHPSSHGYPSSSASSFRPTFAHTPSSAYSTSSQSHSTSHSSSSSRLPIPRARPTKPKPPRTVKRLDHQLIAITHSGGWFRIAFDSSSPPSASSGSTSSSERSREKGKARENPHPPPPQAQKREEGVIGLGRDSTSDCRLVEYRKFGVRAEW